MPSEAAGTWQRMPCVAHARETQATHALLTAAGFLAGFFAGFFAGLGCGLAPEPNTAGVVSRLGRRTEAAYSLTAPPVIGVHCKRLTQHTLQPWSPSHLHTWWIRTATLQVHSGGSVHSMRAIRVEKLCAPRGTTGRSGGGALPSTLPCSPGSGPGAMA